MKRREALKTGILGMIAGIFGRHATTVETTDANVLDVDPTIPHPDVGAEVNVHEYTGWRVTETIRDDGTRSIHYDQDSDARPNLEEVNGMEAAALRKVKERLAIHGLELE